MIAPTAYRAYSLEAVSITVLHSSSRMKDIHPEVLAGWRRFQLEQPTNATDIYTADTSCDAWSFAILRGPPENGVLMMYGSKLFKDGQERRRRGGSSILQEPPPPPPNLPASFFCVFSPRLFHASFSRVCFPRSFPALFYRILFPRKHAVIGETAVVGDSVCLLQGVTLGGTGKETGDRHPKVGKGCHIGAGSSVLGNILVGEVCLCVLMCVDKGGGGGLQNSPEFFVFVLCLLCMGGLLVRGLLLMVTGRIFR